MAAAAPAPSLPIVLSKDGAQEAMQQRGVIIADGNKMSDKTTTIYRLKGKDGKQLCVQFGKGLADMAPCNVVSFVDSEDAGQKRRICFVNMDACDAMRADLDAYVKLIGEQLYEGRQVYWGGRCKEDMSLDEFMERRSPIVKMNRMTNISEAVLKCPEKLTRFWHVSDLRVDDAGKWHFTRRPIVRFTAASRAFTGLLSCNLGLYTGYNKGPTWGVYITVRDALLVPVDLSAKQAASVSLSMDFGAEVQQQDELEIRMVVDNQGGHEEGSSDLEDAGEEDEAPSEGKGKRGMAPGFVEPPTLKRTKRMK